MDHPQRDAVEALKNAVGDLFSSDTSRHSRAQSTTCTACNLLDPGYPGHLPDDGFVDDARTVDVDRTAHPDARSGAAILTASFLYVHGSRKRRRALVAPVGYVTDFTSVPFAFRWLIAQRGKHERATIVHDWLYTLGPRAPTTRKEADQIFRDALHALGTPLWKCVVMYSAARWFGHRSFGARSEWRFRDVATQNAIEITNKMQTIYREIGDCSRAKQTRR